MADVPKEARLRCRLVTPFDNAATAWRLEWVVELALGDAVYKRWAVTSEHDLLGGCKIERVASHYYSTQINGFKEVELRRAKAGSFALAANMVGKEYQILFKGLGKHLKEKKNG